MITTEEIKKLRDKTGVSVMQCKKALEEADGNFEKAIVILRKKTAEIASKKGDRELGSGVVASYLHTTQAVGAMVVLSSETDFVSKNDEFRKLAYNIAMHVAASNPEYLSLNDITPEAKQVAEDVFAEEVKGKQEDLKEKILEGKLASYFSDKVLLQQPYIKNPEITIGELVDEAVQKFGERVEISKYVRLTV